MSLEIVRRIRGNIHGSIDISSLEDKVISHPFFQRLRRIRQLAFLSYVFPGATHTRFEHSLGVMHLAGVAWRKLMANQERLYHALSSYGNFEDIEQEGSAHGRISPTFPLMGKIFQSEEILQTLRLAALLHDVGHPPFSHSGERFLPSWDEVLRSSQDAPDYIKSYITQHIESEKAKGKDPTRSKVRHELFSILMAYKILKDTYQNHPNVGPKIDPRDVISILAPGIQPASDSPLEQFQAGNLCRELISGELDIDRMDYLLRDSRECGVVYGVFDADRILDSLCLYYDDEENKLHVAINLSGLAAFEDYLRARHSMYLQLYFHKSSVAAEAMMQSIANKLGDWRLPADIETYATIDEYNIGQEMYKAAEEKLNSEELILLKQQLDDLLYNRRLWKRVFELSGPPSQVSEEHLSLVASLLKQANIPFEIVSTGSSLTRFSPRHKNQKSSNYLRLIKKDLRQFPRVQPIEDYSDVIRSNQDIIIQRIYVSTQQDDQGVSTAQKAKEVLIQASPD